jgi:hypothetical protein
MTQEQIAAKIGKDLYSTQRSLKHSRRRSKHHGHMIYYLAFGM